MACVVEGIPAIVLGHSHDEPGRVAFFVAHEAGHIARNDCGPESPVLDGDEDAVDDSDTERRANSFASGVLTDDAFVEEFDSLQASDFKQLAIRAVELERARGIEASAAIYSWAWHSRDYLTASMAVRALYRHRGAQRVLRTFIMENVDATNASDADRNLLRCVLDEVPDEGSL